MIDSVCLAVCRMLSMLFTSCSHLTAKDFMVWGCLGFCRFWGRQCSSLFLLPVEGPLRVEKRIVTCQITKEDVIQSYQPWCIAPKNEVWFLTLNVNVYASSSTSLGVQRPLIHYFNVFSRKDHYPSSSRASRGRKFQKKKELYSKERICL